MCINITTITANLPASYFSPVVLLCFHKSFTQSLQNVGKNHHKYNAKAVPTWRRFSILFLVGQW